MVKLILCMKRKPGMTSAEFHHYWKEVHGPLAMGVPEFMRYVRKYVQSHTLDGPVPGLPGLEVPFDGFAEVWFDSREDVGRAYSEPRCLEVILPDGPNFLDVPNCKVAVVEEVLMSAH